MSRMLAIAVREYLAFVRTVGFWLSICLMPAGLLDRDLRHQHDRQGRAAAQHRGGRPHRRRLRSRRWQSALRNPTDRTLRPAVIVAAPGAPYASAAAASQAVRPYLAGELRTPGRRAAGRRRRS